MQSLNYISMVPIIRGADGCIADWHSQRFSLVADGRGFAAASLELPRTTLQFLQGANF